MSQRLENVFYRNIHRASSKHIVTVEANRHRLPNLLPQRREMTYTMRLINDDVTLTASAGTGQTGLFTTGRGRERNRPILENNCKNIMGLVMCT